MIKTIYLKQGESHLKWYKAQPYKFFLDSIWKRHFCCKTHQSLFHTVQEIQRLSEHRPPAVMQTGVALATVQSKVVFAEDETEELKV